jgi:hypothetical protein
MIPHSISRHDGHHSHAVLILVPLLEMLDIMPHEQTQNLLLTTLPALLCGGGFGGLPEVRPLKLPLAL